MVETTLSKIKLYHLLLIEKILEKYKHGFKFQTWSLLYDMGTISSSVKTFLHMPIKMPDIYYVPKIKYSQWLKEGPSSLSYWFQCLQHLDFFRPAVHHLPIGTEKSLHFRDNWALSIEISMKLKLSKFHWEFKCIRVFIRIF